MGKKITVIIADDHAILRQGTAALLRQESDLHIVGEASTGEEAVDLAHLHKPDVIIMDVRMPVLSGVEATRQISRELPGVRVIVLTAHNDDQYVFSAVEAGASGYLLKTAPVTELIDAIRQVHRGEGSLDPVITAKLMRRMAKTSAAESGAAESSGGALTARELEILRALADGLSNKAIAERLVISERTVQTHLTNIYGKLQVSSRTAAILTGIKNGWLVVE